MVQQFLRLNPNTLCELVDKLNLPIMTYNCELWGFHPSEAVEYMHYDIMEYVLKLKTASSNESLYREQENPSIPAFISGQKRGTVTNFLAAKEPMFQSPRYLVINDLALFSL